MTRNKYVLHASLRCVELWLPDYYKLQMSSWGKWGTMQIVSGWNSSCCNVVLL